MTDESPSTTESTDRSLREPPRVLIPIEVLEGETVTDALVEFLAPAEIVILGYHVIPDQTPAEQASMQFEDRARKAIDDIAASFEEEGRDVLTRVVFTHDGDKTIERVAEDVEATAVLLPNPAADVEEVLVPLRGAVDVERLADLVAILASDGDLQVTLWGVASGDADVETDALLTAAEATLEKRGVPDSQVSTETSTVESPIAAIMERSVDFDVIVMGEGRETLLTTVIGEDTERIAEGAVTPVLVVRRRRPESD